MAGKKEKTDKADAAKEELSAQHDLFCREFIIDENQTRAYMRAYPDSSYDAANVSARRLLQNALICARVEQLREERNKRLEIRADKVLARLEARASVTPREFYRPDGSFIPVHELHPDIAIGIKSIEVIEGDDGSRVRKITMVDGKSSDELLGRNLKLWNDVGSATNPMHVMTDEQINAELAALLAKANG